MDLIAAVEVIRAPLAETLPRLSAALAVAIPHQAVAELSGNCSYAPFQAHGRSPGEPRSAITVADLAALRSALPAAGSWQGRVRMAGTEVPVLALSSDITEQGALLVLVRTADTPVSEEHLVSAQALWDLLTAHRESHRAEANPGSLGESRAAAAARAMTIAELGDTHGSALTALLAVLRDRGLDDANARTRAVDLTVSALAALRSRAELDQVLTEERAADAFERLVESLRTLIRNHPAIRNHLARLDFAPPGPRDGADRMLPADVTDTARAVVRAAVHACLEDQHPGLDRDGAYRIHVGWKIGASELRATVRDNGPGSLPRSALDARRVTERLAPLGGRLDVDAVPGWGTTVTIEVPLAPAAAPRSDPLTALGRRELEVLGQLARGRRNRDIARELHISESTVKYHVRKILDKLGTGSRGEAAALAHEWGAA